MHIPERSLFFAPIPLLLLGGLSTLMATPAAADPSAAERTSTASGLSDQVPEIVERSIAFHGGELYSKSRTKLDLCSKSGCFRVEARVEGALFEHSASGRARAGQQTVTIDNENVRRWVEDKPMAVAESEEQALRDWVMARVYFCFLPFRLTDPSVRYRDWGLETWPDESGGERQLHKIEIGFESGTSTDDDDEYLYWFDPETARLEQFAYSYSGNPGGIRFRTLFDHRRVGEILFFDQHNLGFESPNPDIHVVTPERVRDMRRISTVELKNIEVELLEDLP